MVLRGGEFLGTFLGTACLFEGVLFQKSLLLFLLSADWGIDSFEGVECLVLLVWTVLVLVGLDDEEMVLLRFAISIIRFE